MDLNKIVANLKNDFNCAFISTMNYNGKNFAKAIETTEKGFRYRYFKILENDKLEEITDEETLKFFRQMNENTDINNY